MTLHGLHDDHGEGFSPGELLLDYHRWEALSNERAPKLAASVRRWLDAWRTADLAIFPMDDSHRKIMRQGHYLGWFDREHAV